MESHHDNTIEKAFSKVKAQLRKAAEGTRDALWDRIGTLIDQVSPAECANFFKRVYDRLIGTGKHAKIAIATIMRKLVVLANALLRDDRLWTPKEA